MRNSSDNGFSLLEHTADIGIKINGSSLEELFKNAFYGILSIVAETGISNCENKIIKLTAPDKESLLIDFLNELLYLINAEKWLPAEIDKLSINVNIDGNKLEAAIKGKKYTLPDTITTEVKAATYHNIKISNTVDNWETKVFFDI